MELQKIFQLKKIYQEFLETEKIHNSCYLKFKEEFGLEADKEYRNPFYRDWDFEKALSKVRDDILREIIRIFNLQYPNIEIENLDNFVEEKTNQYEHQEKTLVIQFDKIVEYLAGLESKKEELATQYLVKHALNLIPYQLRGNYSDRKMFKAEDLFKNNKLLLWCGFSYSSPNTSEIKYIKKLINVILTGVNPATAEEYNKEIYFKYYQNGRVDIQLKNKEEAEKVAKFLEEQQEEIKEE